jgi:hypothetical protein
MSRLKAISTLALACSVLITGIFAPVPVSSPSGDVNDDRVVNVLDAQATIAVVLGGTAQAGGTDVNRDGRVDILDLQVILARLNGLALPEPAAPADSKTPRAILVSADRSWARVTTACAIEILGHKREEARLAARFSAEPPEIYTPVEERYLFTLTANAPPLVS